MQLFSFPIANLSEKEADDMPVTEGRVQKIEEKINDLIKDLAGFSGQIKGLWAVVSILMSILTAIVVGGGLYLVKEVSDQGTNVGIEINGLKGVRQDLAEVKQDIKQLVFSQRLSKVAVDPQNLSNIKEATNILSNAKQENVRIDSGTIKDTGDKFIMQATVQPESWQAVKGYLNYKSFLNASLAPSLNNLHKSVLLPNPNVHGNIYLNGFGKTDYEKSARFETLDKPRQDGPGPAFLVVTGDSDTKVILDNKYIKNAVIKNVIIVYSGGITHLENVYFVNCTFDFQINPKGQQLGKTILATTAVTFKSST